MSFFTRLAEVGLRLFRYLAEDNGRRIRCALKCLFGKSKLPSDQ